MKTFYVCMATIDLQVRHTPKISILLLLYHHLATLTKPPRPFYPFKKFTNFFIQIL